MGKAVHKKYPQDLRAEKKQKKTIYPCNPAMSIKPMPIQRH